MLIEPAQRPVENGLFLIGRRLVPADRNQCDHHIQAPPVRISTDPHSSILVAFALEELRHFNSLTRIKNVQISAASAERDDLPASSSHQVNVFTLQIPQHQRVNTLPGEAEHHPADQRGLTQTRLAENER